MLLSAQLVLRYSAGMTFPEFEGNVEKQDAIVRRIQVLGEAANQVSAAGRAEMPAVEWHRIIGMRHFVVHQYRDIDTAVVWGVVQEHLPRLIRELEECLS